MNKQNATLLLAATLVTVLNFQSCKKYEEGPSFSLRTVTSRLTGDWEVVRIDTVDFPFDGYSFEFEFEKDGDFLFKRGETYSNGQSYWYAYVGEWEFSSDKSEIEISLNNQIVDFEINKLTNKELWIEDIYGSFTAANDEWRLEKK